MLATTPRHAQSAVRIKALNDIIILQKALSCSAHLCLEQGVPDRRVDRVEGVEGRLGVSLTILLWKLHLLLLLPALSSSRLWSSYELLIALLAMCVRVDDPMPERNSGSW